MFSFRYVTDIPVLLSSIVKAIGSNLITRRATSINRIFTEGNAPARVTVSTGSCTGSGALRKKPEGCRLSKLQSGVTLIICAALESAAPYKIQVSVT